MDKDLLSKVMNAKEIEDKTAELSSIDEQIKQARTAFLDAEAAWVIEQKRLRQVWLDLMEKRTEIVKEKTAGK
jgi:predicted  nucleic acid-binding Zn-ribbon protein